ncbi:MAG: hypothetical protein L3J97_00750 [Thermoplasmata archaeon]|nr:hypothetical protein [Thermoplasmata archaeon]
MAGLNPTAQNIVQALSSQSTLLMKMRILSFGKNYDVMDANHRVLCQIGLDAGQNVAGQMLGSAVSSFAGEYIGRYAARSMNYTYTVKDAGGNLGMEIRKTGGGNHSQFQVNDTATRSVVGFIDLTRSLIGGLKATWLAPGGQPLMSTKGNILRRKYSIRGPDGRDIGRVRHKILAIRDVWQLELDPGSNHLFSSIFATILDFEKEM